MTTTAPRFAATAALALAPPPLLPLCLFEAPPRSPQLRTNDSTALSWLAHDADRDDDDDDDDNDDGGGAGGDGNGDPVCDGHTAPTTGELSTGTPPRLTAEAIVAVPSVLCLVSAGGDNEDADGSGGNADAADARMPLLVTAVVGARTGGVGGGGAESRRCRSPSYSKAKSTARGTSNPPHFRSAASLTSRLSPMSSILATAAENSLQPLARASLGAAAVEPE
eukprot:CAMPEP_0171688432 /NCGR_PEP_ID=MMETSP0991-20121206/3889_1 /TAXON_ID=483369 /ORGANISM="non described non described, Strain CCMP2098" /LENGTH=222 /DNA_ID=CAMNT_0012276367 /DNA_START=414 /DNA_END=1083 /DNA_ORIENTATION=-